MNTMFDTLLQLPLFQGLAHDDFTNILAKVKLGFRKHKAGEVIAARGDTCNGLIFVLKGEIAATTPFADRQGCSMTEFFQAPFVIELSSLFGMNTAYVATHVAQTEVHTVNISKEFVRGELLKYDIFRLNYTNILSNRAQNLHRQLWMPNAAGTEKLIARFILTHVEQRTGRKILKMKMDELAQMLDQTRPQISKSLNNMQQSGLLELHRGGIIVPEARALNP